MKHVQSFSLISLTALLLVCEFAGGCSSAGRRQSGGAAWSLIRNAWSPDLYAVWGSSPTDVFAVGEAFEILHYDGAAWSSMISPQPGQLEGVWGASSSDVFAVGNAETLYPGEILHYDGSSWSTMFGPGTTGFLQAVWGTSPSDVFAAGSWVWHYDGASWTEMTNSPGGDSIWGSSSSDVFVTVIQSIETSVVFRYDGATWTAMAFPPSLQSWLPYRNVTGLWGSSATNVLATAGTQPNANECTIIRYDGAAWSQMDCRSTTVAVATFWGSSATDVFAVGADSNHDAAVLHYDGSSWSPMRVPPAAGLSAVWGSSPVDVFAVGDYGTILHYGP
jgi:hypothetical protein